MPFTTRELLVIKLSLEGKTDEEIRKTIPYYDFGVRSTKKAVCPKDRYIQIKAKILRKTEGYIKREKEGRKTRELYQGRPNPLE